MHTHAREIQIYYNPDSSSDRRCVAHARSMGTKVKAYDYAKTPSNGTSWRQIVKNLDCHPKDLMDKSHPYYQQHIRGRDFHMTGWLEILRRNPFLLRAPIAMRGGRAVFCQSPTDIYKLTETAGVSTGRSA